MLMMIQVIYACLLVNGVFINLLLNHGVCGLQGIYFFASAQVANVGCMCSVIVYFLHCICVCDCDSRHESLIMLSPSVMVRRSHLLARCYLGMMCMCTTRHSQKEAGFLWSVYHRAIAVNQWRYQMFRRLSPLYVCYRNKKFNQCGTACLSVLVLLGLALRADVALCCSRHAY
jgi:hypothetical protein